MRRLLALDQASKTTGWSYFEGDNLKEFGKFTANDDDIGERLYFIRDKVRELINKYNINEVAFEDIQLQNNVGTFKVLAEVFGIIYELVTELNIPHTAVLSSTWKSTLGIRGKNRTEQKKNAKEYAQNTYNIKCTQDEADAICIGSHMVHKKKKIETGFDWSD